MRESPTVRFYAREADCTLTEVRNGAVESVNEVTTVRAAFARLMRRIDPAAVVGQRKVLVNVLTGCWEWVGARDSRGYGNVRVGRRVRKAHRVVYEAARGPIAEGLDCDHLCRVPWCVNSDHLELVPHGENVRRGAARWVPAARQRAKRQCPRGHRYTKANTYVQPSTGGRACRICARARKRAAATARRAEAA